MAEHSEEDIQPQPKGIVPEQRAPMTLEESVAKLRELRFNAMPILKALMDEYTNRARPGYPTLVDNIDGGGVFGINFDPGFGLYFMTDGSRVYAELHRVSLRTDALSAANHEKFSGRPVQQEFSIDFEADALDQARKLISRLIHAWVDQQTSKYRVDS